MLSEGFFVRRCEEHEVASRLEALLREVLEGNRHRRCGVEHVDRAAPPDHAVDELAAEGIPLPSVRIHRHHVDVAHQAQTGRARVAAFDPCDQAGATGKRLEALEVEAIAFQVGREQIGVLDLLAGLLGALIDASITDEVLEQLGDFAGRIRHAASLLRALGAR